MTLVQRVELTTSVATINLSSIPNTYTDLYLLISARSNASAGFVDMNLGFNGSTANFSGRRLYGAGSGSPVSVSQARFVAEANAATSTSSTFGNAQIYIPNYASSNNKSYSSEGVTEANATLAYMSIYAGLWSNTAAITSIELTLSSGSFVSGSTVTLYGITKGSDGIVTVS